MELTRKNIRRTLTATMQTGFDEAFRRVKEWVADFRANEIVVSSLWLESIGTQRRRFRCDGLDRQIDALVYDLYALTPAEIKIVESASAESPARQGKAAK